MNDNIANLEAENQRLKHALQDLVKLSHDSGHYVGSNIPTLDYYDYISGGIGNAEEAGSTED